MFNAFVQQLLIYYNSNLYVFNQRISHYYIHYQSFFKKSQIWDIGKERLNDLYSHHLCEFV